MDHWFRFYRKEWGFFPQVLKINQIRHAYVANLWQQYKLRMPWGHVRETCRKCNQKLPSEHNGISLFFSVLSLLSQIQTPISFLLNTPSLAISLIEQWVVQHSTVVWFAYFSLKVPFKPTHFRLELNPPHGTHCNSLAIVTHYHWRMRISISFCCIQDIWYLLSKSSFTHFS